ncbi:MAG: hypothetical protein HYT71_00320 [Candidatus Aenigmarchaeota archaeon]|nr:hypothetical protein [Candidatus Aenigmarchaeota archaeon]
MVTKEELIERFRAKQNPENREEPAPAESPWKKILFHFILALVYFITISWFKFWTFGLFWIIIFVLIGLWVFSINVPSVSELIMWSIMIVVVVGGILWLFTLSPWRPAINTQVNAFMTGFNKISDTIEEYKAGLDCIFNPGLERCLKTPEAGTKQSSRKGLEITTLSSESSVSVGKTARLFAAVRNDGESDAIVRSARMYGGEGRTFMMAGAPECTGCAIGITNEKIIPNSRRDLTADLIVPCEKTSSFPFSLNVEYGYKVTASMPVDVLNSKDYDDKTAAKEAFLSQPSASSSSGPVIASIVIGVEGYQPIKGGTKNILFAKLTNLGPGTFKLENAKVSVQPETQFIVSNCKINGAPVGKDITNLVDPSDRSYSTEKFISLSCDMDVKDVDGQKRFIATIDANYFYNTTRSSEMGVDPAGYDECSASSKTSTIDTTEPPTP